MARLGDAQIERRIRRAVALDAVALDPSPEQYELAARREYRRIEQEHAPAERSALARGKGDIIQRVVAASVGGES